MASIRKEVSKYLQNSGLFGVPFHRIRPDSQEFSVYVNLMLLSQIS